MDKWYNPVVRSFNAYRQALMAFGLPRERLRPDARLEELVPAPLRREAWDAMRRRGLRLPDLGLSNLDGWGCLMAFAVVMGIVWAKAGGWLAAAAGVPLAVFLYFVSRPWATEPATVETLGELAMYGVDFTAHRESGYRWSRGDIALKVRIILGEAANVPLAAIREETTLDELFD